MDLVQLGDGPFRSDCRIRVLPDVKIWSCSVTASELTRTRSLAADGDDSLVFCIVKNGQTSVAQRNQEQSLSRGDALLWSSEAAGVCHNPGLLDIVTFAFPRRSLSSVVGDLDHALMKAIPATTEAVRLLLSYAEILQTDSAPLEPSLLSLSSSHILDLAAVALGATRDATQNAKDGGVRAARLQAIKSDIIANLSQPSLDVAALAVRHGISPRYIRALFESEDTSFTDFVREQRLRRAYRLLTAIDNDRNVSGIAFDSGFGDLSYFNHSFRRRFGATPTDVRSQARVDVARSRESAGQSAR
jgi:AraC-like DNA-binding protein